jgi:FkbM family methyltransferase
MPIRNAVKTGHGPAMGVARRVIASTGADPIVEYGIGDVTLHIPLSHELPRIRARYPTYGSNQGSVAASVLEKYPNLSAIDIGANIGDTVAFWRGTGNFPVLAVEPSERYLQLLALNAAVLGNVIVHAGLVGEADRDELVAIEERLGTARVVAGSRPRRITRLTSLVEAYPAFQDAKLLKIDTDGHDSDVIRGGRDWIAKARPAIFFEFAPFLSDPQKRPLLETIETLLSVGYERMLFYDNAGEFALTVHASERERIEELHAHALSWRNERYWDVAAFHGEDQDVAMSLRLLELQRSRT